MNESPAFTKALNNYIRSLDSTALEVTGYKERTIYSGGCETCAFEGTVVDIFYTDAEGEQTYTYDGEFAVFLKALIDNS